MSAAFRIIAHILLFALALAALWGGLGVGLQYNPAIGTVMLLAALGIAAANTFWIFRTKGRRR